MATFRLFSTPPNRPPVNDGQPLVVGTEFYVTSAAWVTHLHVALPNSGINTGVRTFGLYDMVTSALVATKTATPTSGMTNQWLTVTLDTPYALVVNRRYRVVVLNASGQYVGTNNYWSSNVTQGILVATSAANTTNNDQSSYQYSSTLVIPQDSWQNTNYWLDVTVTDTDPTPSTNTGTITAVLPKLAASASGTVTDPGQISAILPKLAASASGTVTVFGAISVSLPALQASLTATQRVSGAIAATLPMLQAHAEGSVGVSGAIQAALPVLTASAVATVRNPGLVSAVLPMLQAKILAETPGSSFIDATLPMLEASIIGTVTNPGAVQAVLPAFGAKIIGEVATTGSLVAVLPALQANALIETLNSGAIDAQLPMLQAKVLGVVQAPEREDILVAVEVSRDSIRLSAALFALRIEARVENPRIEVALND